MKPIILKDLPETDYHSQTGEKTPLFSYSTAKRIIQESAYHAHMYHPLLGGEKKEPTKPMIKGSIIHGMILGGGPDISILNFDNYKTKVAQETKAAVIAEDKIPILQKDMDNLRVAVACIKAKIQILAPYFFDSHESELSIRWEMDNGVKTQSRFDWIQHETGLIIELKTTKDANPRVLDKYSNTLGYEIQLSTYMQAAEKTWPDMAGRFKWKFIFIEPEAPYMISVNDVDSSMFWLGDSELRRASKKWKECLESDNWPGYGENTISAPPWAVSREEMEGE